MKFRRKLCLVLICFVLLGCTSCQSYSGDMEKALTALEWQDYATAIGESDAFLKRVPHSTPAQLVRQTAAWEKLFLASETQVSLPGSTLIFGNKEYVRDMYGNHALTLKAFSNHIFRDYDLLECAIYFENDVNYFDRDTEISLIKPKLTVRYTISGTERTATLSVSKLRKSGITEEQFLKNYFVLSTQFLDRTMIPALEELFTYLQDTHGLSPQQLGFTAWDLP